MHPQSLPLHPALICTAIAMPICWPNWRQGPPGLFVASPLIAYLQGWGQYGYVDRPCMHGSHAIANLAGLAWFPNYHAGLIPLQY